MKHFCRFCLAQELQEEDRQTDIVLRMCLVCNCHYTYHVVGQDDEELFNFRLYAMWKSDVYKGTFYVTTNRVIITKQFKSGNIIVLDYIPDHITSHNFKTKLPMLLVFS